MLLAAGADGAVHFVDLLTGDVDSLLPEAAPERPLLCAALSTDCAWLATSGARAEHCMSCDCLACVDLPVWY